MMNAKTTDKLIHKGIENETALKKKQRELYDEEDKLERERDAFLEDVRNRLSGEIVTDTIMTFSFEIV